MAKRPIRADDLLRFIFVGDPQISPDGDRVLFARKTITEKNAYLSHLFTVDLEGNLVQWTQGEKSVGQGRWSPDGGTIAFVADRDETGDQIYLLATSGGEARKLTNLPEGSIGEIRWSPDSRRIAFTHRPARPGTTRKETAERKEKGLSDAPVETEDIWYRLDGDGYFGEARYGLHAIEVSVGELSPLGGADAEGHPLPYRAAANGDYGFDWSPGSDELIVSHTASARPFADPPNVQLYRLKLDGKVRQLPGLPTGEKSAPRWSPDGAWIAYAGDVDEKDPWGTRNVKAYLVSAEGGTPTDLTGSTDLDLEVATLSDTKEAAFGASLQWAPDGSGLFTQVGSRGEQQLAFIPRAGGVQLLTEGRHTLAVGSVSRDGRRFAGVRNDPVRLPEVVVIEPELATGRMIPRYLTDLNHAFHEEVEIPAPEELNIPTTDGETLHGWILRPSGAGPFPGVLQVHGGPHTQYGWAFFHEFQVQVAAGYAVVYTNPRGSKGYGEAWTSAIRNDWGGKDWEDIQAATRWMENEASIESGRIAIMGGSYGGYMTNWAIGHSDAYRCAITDRCVSNMVSMAGNSDFPFNKDGYFQGVAWGSLEEIKELWRQSPISRFQDVKTPTLIIHSEGDLRCNIEQGEQVFTALQQQGVPSRFVRYPRNTSHGMSRNGPPDMRLHRLGEILGWLGRYL